MEILEQVLVSATSRFKLNRLETPRLDAEVLLAQVLGCSRAELYSHGKEAISAHQVKSFEELVLRRMAGEPIAYLLGFCEFYGLRFQVSNKVLIPRGDTELLVETVLDNIGKMPCDATGLPTILDIGTGSGCIAITLALQARVAVDAWDISPDALAIAAVNAKRLAATVNFKCRDMLDTSSYIPGDKYDFIVANPPYIALTDKHNVSASVVDFEPPIALFGGSDGLQYYRQMAAHCDSILNEYGRLLLEIGYNQANDVTKILADHGFKQIEVHQDIAGNDRVVVATGSAKK